MYLANYLWLQVKGEKFPQGLSNHKLVSKCSWGWNSHDFKYRVILELRLSKSLDNIPDSFKLSLRKYLTLKQVRGKME